MGTLSRHLLQVRFEGRVKLVDDDFIDSDETKTIDDFFQECFVDPLDPVDEITCSECVGDDVRVELSIKCSLLADNAKQVTVSTTATLFEEKTCLNHDRDAGQVRFTPPLHAFEGDPTLVWLNSPEAGEEHTAPPIDRFAVALATEVQ